jgi:hypothetical protein
MNSSKRKGINQYISMVRMSAPLANLEPDRGIILVDT